MIDGILTLDSGERSVKFSLFSLPGSQSNNPRRVLRGAITGIGAQSRLHAWDERGRPLEAGDLPPGEITDHASAMAMLANWVRVPAREVRLIGIAHRVVHGASRDGAELVTQELLTELRRLAPMAPLHQPYNLAGIEAAQKFFDGPHQVACFDTAFHRQQPEVARTLPLPLELSQRGLVSYGFNGLAFESIALRLNSESESLSKRLVVCYLGRDAGLCAIRNGRSVAASSGFSLLGGLPMGSRSGNIDPGVLLYLLRQEGYTPEQLEYLLYRRSGMLGVSGFSADMRVLLDSKFPRAAVAVELLCYRIIRELGSMAAALQGLDALVFTGRTGVSAAPIRAAVCRNARWLGLHLDPVANQKQQRRLHQDDSRVEIWSLPSEEDWLMARQAQKLLSDARAA